MIWDAALPPTRRRQLVARRKMNAGRAIDFGGSAQTILQDAASTDSG
jgi:hypothetical protein